MMSEEWTDVSTRIRLGVADSIVLKQFKIAEFEDCAGSMNWLKRELLCLKALLENQSPLQLFTDGQMKQVTSIAEFHDWVKKELPDAHLCFFAPKPNRPRY